VTGGQHRWRAARVFVHSGVREDVTDIVLNVKEIALRMEGEGPKRMICASRARACHRRRYREPVGDRNPEPDT
jgi:hypothetical protein